MILEPAQKRLRTPFSFLRNSCIWGKILSIISVLVYSSKGVRFYYRSPIYEPSFPSYNSPPTFLVLPSNQSSLDNILDVFNSTAQHCNQEINEGIFKQDSRVIFFFQKDSFDNLFTMARSIFAPNSYFRSMPKVAIAYVTAGYEGGKIMVYRHVHFCSHIWKL